ncbi:putative receptor-like protein kinase At4g00960 isoform X2 [Triticum aestivum]|uniref:putative receptor-like protein kinase At4g00960 isoform X2 n=1 Tax=Triticum aestivum TaxID=4565 RepID=UPI001D005196|nr:putative receptor-like protein kinase At4g00960 isoform X2 [Triticum aestivum]
MHGVQDNGECIAVKKLHPMPVLDDEEFKSEFSNLLRVKHQNTIPLVGYCHHTAQVLLEHNGKHVSARVEEIYLCSEYLEGGTLDKHLSNEPCALVWHTCYKIIKGICEGLHYLHKGFEYPIYHLELKPTKILLDNEMMPKIGGFGFSGFLDTTETFNTSEVMRTSLYMPPEYISKRQITPKFDVFSLGVIILQIMAGKESYPKCADIPPEEFIEPVYEFWVDRMQGTISKHTSHEVRTCIEIALSCVEFNRVKRPTINEIIQRLNKIDIVECSSIGELYKTEEFAFDFLKHITNGFSKKNIIGHGGYGIVYKGLLDNGEEIAVKKLHQMLWIEDEQFKNEVNNLMRVQHKNIVRLVGYCHHTSQIFVEHEGKHVSASVVERAICFEHKQGGSLDNQLSGKEGYFNCPHTPPREFIKHVREKWRVRLQATMSSHVTEEVRTCIEIALKCVEDDRKRRPAIATIVNELSNIGIARSSPVGQWANKLTALKSLLLSTHFKHWLVLLVAAGIAIFFAWLQFCPDSWCRSITRRT